MDGTNGAVTASKVSGKAAQQFGINHLHADCPQCGQPIHADGPGRIFCRVCHHLVEFAAPDGYMRTDLKAPQAS